MTYEKMIENLKSPSLQDIEYYEVDPNKIHITIIDCAELDENWEPIELEYRNPKAVDDLIKMLETECVKKSEDYSTTYYYFNDFSVDLDYSSSYEY